MLEVEVGPVGTPVRLPRDNVFVGGTGPRNRCENGEGGILDVILLDEADEVVEVLLGGVWVDDEVRKEADSDLAGSLEGSHDLIALLSLVVFAQLVLGDRLDADEETPRPTLCQSFMRSRSRRSESIRL